MRIREVRSAEDIRQFIKLPISLYKNESRWIRPLDVDVENVFDPKKNKAFQNGEIIRWILTDDNNTVIGRVAAFIDRKIVNKGNEQPTGGIGFFECINNQEAAFMLFDQCKQWLAERGMEAMDGPVNFGNRDRWWGLLVEGFEREPNYQCNYNFPYYRELFEAYGFQVYFYQFTFGRKIMGPLSDKMEAKARLIEQNPDYRFGYPKKIEAEELAKLIRQVYNKAWAKRGEIPELTESQAKHLVKQMKPIMDKHLLWFGYFKDEPIAFFLSLPEVNQIFKHVNGKLDVLGKLKFLWFKTLKKNRKAFGVLFGIVPEHQGKGVDGGIIIAFKKLVQHKYLQYTDYEMNWIGDFNPKMIKVAEQIEAEVVKKHATYRKLFDESKPFKRMPIIG